MSIYDYDEQTEFLTNNNGSKLTKPQKQIAKETGLSQQEVSRKQKAIRTNTNLLRKNVYKVAQTMGIKKLTVEIN